MPKWADLLIGLCLGLFIAGGLFFLYLGLRNVWLSWASLSWPFTSGVVAESRIEKSVSRDSDTGVQSTTHDAKLKFSFSVRDAQYQTDKLYFGQTGGSSDSSEAELLRLRYPPGSPVRVYHDPGDPSRAVVKPGFHADVLWLPGAGVAFALAGVMFLAMYFSSQSHADGMTIGVALFALIFALAGGSMLAAGGRNLWLALSSRGWPVAGGEIVYSVGESAESASTGDDGYTTRSRTYSTRIVYSYPAGGARRYGNVRQFGQISGSDAEWAAVAAARYPKGRAVTVSYRPGDEDTSVLEPGLHPDAFWIPGIGLACLLFALGVAFSIVPEMRRNPF